MTDASSLDGPELRARVKGEIRRRMRQIRGALPEPTWREKSREVCARAMELERLRDARAIAAYVPIKREVDPTSIVEAVRARGGRVALPRVRAETGVLTFHWVDAATALEAGPLGTSEPPASTASCAPDEIDVVLVPALALAPDGARIGYGRGYYDRTLPSLTRALRVSMAFDFQLIPEVPVTEGDVAVSVVVTERRVFHCGAAIATSNPSATSDASGAGSEPESPSASSTAAVSAKRPPPSLGGS